MNVENLTKQARVKWAIADAKWAVAFNERLGAVLAEVVDKAEVDKANAKLVKARAEGEKTHAKWVRAARRASAGGRA